MKTDTTIRPPDGGFVPYRSTVLPYLFYVAGIFIVGGLLAYPAFSIATAGFGMEIPFHRFLLRFLKLLSLLGLLPLMVALALNTKRHWGYGGNAHSFTVQFFIGLAIGTASVLWIYVFLWLFDIRLLAPVTSLNATDWVRLVMKALTTGFVVALIEETWFRGALQGALTKTHSTLSAVAVTAGLYGIVHFIRADTAPLAQPDWFSGFVTFGNLFARLQNPAIMPDLLALIAAGVWLSLVRIHTGRVAQAIGIHAGWVMVLKMGKTLTESNPQSELGWLVGGYNGVIGWLGFAWFAMLAGIYYRAYVRRADRQP